MEYHKEKREQGIKKLFEQIMTKNFPNLVKEKDTQVQESQSCKKDGPKETHTKTHHIKTGKLKDKERVTKAARERLLVTYKEASINLSADFSTETFYARRD